MWDKTDTKTNSVDENDRYKIVINSIFDNDDVEVVVVYDQIVRNDV